MKEENKQALALAAAGLGGLMVARGLMRRLGERFNLRDKTVLITGGSRGLGLILARQLAQEGARISICARSPEELERARADLIARGAKVLAVPCDVTDRAQVGELVQMTEKRFGRVDVLINNAGTIQVGPMDVMQLEEYEKAMRIHFWAPLYTTLAVLPAMKRRGAGHIVNITSIGGKISVPHLLPYSASKFALVGLSNGLRAELAKYGVTVTTVVPGLMRTGSPRNANFKGKHRAEYAWFAISDSLPVASMSADRAARQIIAAMKRGDAETILSLPAVLAVKFYSLFPEATADILATVNRLLPEADKTDLIKGTAKGKESESPLAPSVLTTLSDRAAERNNEMD
jgi:short-subunit dehydrogenase